MRQLLFTNTPAHVHLYKYATEELQSRGHEVRLLARDYGCTTALLDRYDLPHSIYGSCDTTKASLLWNLPGHYTRIARQARAFDPDVIFGMGGYAAFAGLITRTPTVLILDSEPTTIDHAISTPLAEAILTPAAFRKDLGERQYVFEGFKESAYLHPDVRSNPDGIREDLDVEHQDPLVIARFNAFGSHHDIGRGGFTTTQRRRLIETIGEDATVLVSDESDDLELDGLPARRFDLHPARLHDALAEADLLIADSQTMVTEAALLGTPAIRSNGFVGEDDMGNFIELESQGLVYNLESLDAVIRRAKELLENHETSDEWQRRADAYLRNQVNLTEVIVEVATDVNRIDRLDALRSR